MAADPGRTAAGGDDEGAFEALVRPHLDTLARFIRARVGDGEHVADLLQEALIHAWRDRPRLRDAERVRPWLLAIARNRCRDYLKRAERREVPTGNAELDLHIGRLGPALTPTDGAGLIREAVETLPVQDRELLHSFYLQGYSIAEIAAREGRPVGTVKRRLFGAREHLREALAVPAGEGEAEMSPRKSGSRAQPFPRRRPEIRISPSRAAAFAVDCQELHWWFGRPMKGDHTIWAQYYPPDWRVRYVYDMQAVRDASVHGLDCAEIEVAVWERETGWAPGEWTMWGRLTNDAVEWLAVAHLTDGRRTLSTSPDEEFGENWGGPVPRRLEDRGRFAEEAPGVLTQRKRTAGEIGAGMFALQIGERQFTCLRVLDVDPDPQPGSVLLEAYLTREGRTVLCRRYNERSWGSASGRAPWDEALPANARLIVDGVTFVHWYDCLTGLAVGL